MNESASEQDERIWQAADQLFSEAKYWSELTRGRVLELAGGNLGMAAFERVFPGRQFTAMRHASSASSQRCSRISIWQRFNHAPV